MKVILVLIIIVVAGGLALYYGGGYSSFDPSQQGRDARAAIEKTMSQGTMTWTQVCDVAGPPRQYQVMIKQTRTIDGVEQEFFKPGPFNNFDRDALAARIDEGSLEGGFNFEFQFSASVAFMVAFDEFGNAEAVNDLVTMKTLLVM